MRKPNLEKERKGNKQRETTVGRNGEEFGKNGWYGEGLAHEGERRGLRVWQAEQGVHTYPERPTGWGWWSPSRAARLCVAAGWRWRERRGGGLERELKGGKGRRENERGEARRAREASVVSVRPLWRSRQDCVGPHLFLLSLPPPPDPHHRLPSRPPSHNQPPPLPSRHHLARPPPFAPLCVSSPLCVSRAHPSPHPRLCFVFYASPPYPTLHSSPIRFVVAFSHSLRSNRENDDFPSVSLPTLSSFIVIPLLSSSRMLSPPLHSPREPRVNTSACLVNFPYRSEWPVKGWANGRLMG